MKLQIRRKSKNAKNKYIVRNQKDNTITMKTNNVDRAHVTIVNWENDRGEQERLISWNDEYDGEPIVVQIQLTRNGRNWTARMEEWDAKSPVLLRKGTDEIRLDKLDEID
jgi:hypothetical protein